MILCNTPSSTEPPLLCVLVSAPASACAAAQGAGPTQQSRDAAALKGTDSDLTQTCQSREDVQTLHWAAPEATCRHTKTERTTTQHKIQVLTQPT